MFKRLKAYPDGTIKYIFNNDRVIVEDKYGRLQTDSNTRVKNELVDSNTDLLTSCLSNRRH